LPEKKRGRGFLLGNDFDQLLQLYLNKIQSSSGPIIARIAMAAACGLLLAGNRHKLVENGGHVKLNRQWAYSLFKQMNLVPRKPMTSKSKHSVKKFAKVKKEFLQEVFTTVELKNIPPETGIKVVPTTTWKMERGFKKSRSCGK